MVADGKGTTFESVELLAKRTTPHREQIRLPQYSIRLHCVTDSDVGAFVDDPDAGADYLGSIDDYAAGGVQLAHQSGQIAFIGTEPLRVVIEMRKINERQIGTVALENFGSAPG